MTFEDWSFSCTPKTQGSWNLHTLLPRGMDFFICLSSLTSIIGNGGQANYAAGNTYMDELVRHRALRGEKATTINLGWVQSEGAVAENPSLVPFFSTNEYMSSVSITELHALLDYYCNPNLDIDGLFSRHVITGLSTPAAATLESGPRDLPWFRKRTFRHLLQTSLEKGQVGSSTSGTVANYASMFLEAATIEDATRVVTTALVQKLSKALSIPQEDVDTSKPLHTFGVDSLLAVELKNYFTKEFDAEVAIFDIMGVASFENLSSVVVRKSKARSDEWA